MENTSRNLNAGFVTMYTWFSFRKRLESSIYRRPSCKFCVDGNLPLPCETRPNSANCYAPDDTGVGNYKVRCEYERSETCSWPYKPIALVNEDKTSDNLLYNISYQNSGFNS